MKIYHIRLTGNEIVDVPENEYRPIEDAVLQKSERMIKVSGVTFSPRDVKRVTSTYKSEVPEGWQDAHPEITDEHRANNLRRMRWLRTYFFEKHKVATNIPEDEKEGYRKFVEWYESPAQVERRSKKQEFRAEFFDVYFATHEEMEASFQAWLKATAPDADPREYDRSKLTPVALGMRDVTEAENLFAKK